MMRAWIAGALVGLAAVATVPTLGAPKGVPQGAPKKPATPGVDFNRDVRPVLSRHCFKCHGPDDKTREAGLRLDDRTSALALKAIVPGKPHQSSLVERILSKDEALVMPPPATKNPLSERDKEVLRRWIAEGAEYRPHWAFVAPKLPALPPVKRKDWPRSGIDHFVLARMEKQGLQPSPPADRYTLIRRVYLDLIGIPPTPEETVAFIKDPSPNAYEKVVDRLLASPHYGERWARKWLDLARYADTNGYEKDRPRSVWPYRDWVINALNADMPFNQFTVEQLAGDMLGGPGGGPTLQQRIATGFHRNTMLNEEGGIDPLEFRFHAMTDRVSTTGTTWLGLTIGCAQCHTHKYDPIPHREYYQFMAFLNNADEPEIEVPLPDIQARRAELEKQIAAREADLAERFPPEGEIRWHSVAPVKVTAEGGAQPHTLPDASVRISGPNPERNTYTLILETEHPDVEALRLEALTDSSLGGNGPGRTPHGNFVLSELTATVTPRNAPGEAQAVKFTSATADFSQDGFAAGGVIDGNPKTGWAIHGKEPWNVNRSLTLALPKPVSIAGGTRWTIKLEQQHGSQHTLGRFRISLGQRASDGRPLEVRRREHRDRKFQAWLSAESARAVRWTRLRPASAKSNLPLLTILEDGSVLSSGDQSKRDVYDLSFPTDLRGITAVRIETVPDERLPRFGPGRVYYEGPIGDFFLSEVTVAAGGTKVPIASASHSFANGGSTAQAAIDGDPQTGWSINGGQGRPHTAVFNLKQPLDPAGKLDLGLLFERYYACGMGRFRVSVTTDPRPARAGLPVEIEELLLVPGGKRTAAQREQLLRHFLSVALELAGEREEIRKLRAQLPSFPTTLVFTEQPDNNPRPTFIHNRGEFLQPRERVEPGVLSFLPPLPREAPRNRLTFARWLVDPQNPLVGRVVVNRHWAALFGQGIVRTTEDFGFQGEPPSHPELLDYLAVLFTTDARGQGPGVRGRESRQQAAGSGQQGSQGQLPIVNSPKPRTHEQGLGWSLKRLHKLIVTSATYQQSSRVTPELLAKDPQNRWLARAPRVRLEAELIRDYALKASELLSTKIGGPSVFPPQPPGVTSEGTYGPLAWNVSTGEDRYRRGMYTFAKRTAPYAMFTTFDGPSGEACVARREVSNTPLQALTLLNDTVFLEAAQALGRMLAAKAGTPEERLTYLFQRCLTRPPDAQEQVAILRYYQAQLARLRKKELDGAKIAGSGEGDVAERAAWTLVARSLLNLDEAIVKQ